MRYFEIGSYILAYILPVNEIVCLNHGEIPKIFNENNDVILGCLL